MPSEHRRRANLNHLELNLTPLLDVVLQLITFFMMLVHFGTKIEAAERDVRLPVTPAALPGPELLDEAIVVTIDESGDLVVGNRALRGDQARQWWQDQASIRFRGATTLGIGIEELPTRIIVRADRTATFGDVRSMLATAQEVGFARFSLVVQRRETP